MPGSCNPIAAATWWATSCGSCGRWVGRSGSRSSARSTNHVPLGKARRTCAATRCASRVFPTPPTPVKVTRREADRRRLTSRPCGSHAPGGGFSCAHPNQEDAEEAKDQSAHRTVACVLHRRIPSIGFVMTSGAATRSGVAVSRCARRAGRLGVRTVGVDDCGADPAGGRIKSPRSRVTASRVCFGARSVRDALMAPLRCRAPGRPEAVVFAAVARAVPGWRSPAAARGRDGRGRRAGAAVCARC
jgi:hypothetical protein